MFDGHFKKRDNFSEHDKDDLVPESGKFGNTALPVFSFKNIKKFGVGFYQTILG